MLTKTEIKVLELFTSKILSSFSIREISRLINRDIKIVYTSVKSLIKKEFITKNSHNLLCLNYKKNKQILAYIENIRKEDFFEKNNLIKIHLNNFLTKTKNHFFVLLIFGSYASGNAKKNSDVDLLLISPELNQKFERELKASLSTSIKKFDINVIDSESFREMLQKRDEFNVVNETFNNHIILQGAEQYYSLLGERDVN
jgi:predicted nucleotidyltransferase